MTAEATELLSEIRAEIAKQSSPWANRKMAAAYCGGCSVGEIDKAVARGDIKRHYRSGTPIFKKHGGKGSLDYWIEHCPMPQSQITKLLTHS